MTFQSNLQCFHLVMQLFIVQLRDQLTRRNILPYLDIQPDDLAARLGTHFGFPVRIK
ncbi:hypothetical protein D3C86_2165530 [compost metagenome]